MQADLIAIYRRMQTLENQRRVAVSDFRRAAYSVCEVLTWKRQTETPVRKVRFSDDAWEFIRTGAGTTHTMTHLVICGAIVESLLLLHEAGEDIEPHLKLIRESAARKLHDWTDERDSIYGDVERRLRQYGIRPKDALRTSQN